MGRFFPRAPHQVSRSGKLGAPGLQELSRNPHRALRPCQAPLFGGDRTGALWAECGFQYFPCRPGSERSGNARLTDGLIKLHARAASKARAPRITKMRQTRQPMNNIFSHTRQVNKPFSTERSTERSTQKAARRGLPLGLALSLSLFLSVALGLGWSEGVQAQGEPDAAIQVQVEAPTHVAPGELIRLHLRLQTPAPLAGFEVEVRYAPTAAEFA